MKHLIERIVPNWHQSLTGVSIRCLTGVSLYMKGIFFQNGFLNRNNLKKCLIENIHSTKTNKVVPSQKRMNKSLWRNSSYMKVHSPNTLSLLRWEIKTLKLFSTQKRKLRRLKRKRLNLRKRKLRRRKRSQKLKRQTRIIHLETLSRLMTANYVGLRANLRLATLNHLETLNLLATHRLRPSQGLLLMR